MHWWIYGLEQSRKSQPGVLLSECNAVNTYRAGCTILRTLVL